MKSTPEYAEELAKCLDAVRKNHPATETSPVTLPVILRFAEGCFCQGWYSREKLTLLPEKS